MKVLNKKTGLIFLILIVCLVSMYSVVVFAAETDDSCAHNSWSYEADGTRIVASCDACGKCVSVSLSISGCDEGNVFYACAVGSGNFTVASDGWDTDLGVAKYVHIAYGTPDGSGGYKYSTKVPTEPGQYVVKLVASKRNSLATSGVLAESDTADFSIAEGHKWSYSAEEFSLYACCDCCGYSTGVTLETTSAMAASRKNAGGRVTDNNFEYELIDDQGWCTQTGIETYYLLYTGLETENNDYVIYNHNAFESPKQAGDYTVKLVLLTDPDDYHSVYLETRPRAFYLAAVSYGTKAYNYTDVEKASFGEPELIDGCYNVYTREELLWLACSGKTDITLQLMDDIVLNPITFGSDMKTMLTGSTDLYNWIGFGTQENPVNVTIHGNNHTIYGLYNSDETGCHGLVNYVAARCEIDNLTISDAFLKGATVGAFVGSISAADASVKLENCNVLYTKIQGVDTAGGFIGMIDSVISAGKPGVVTEITDCVSDAEISVSGANGIAAGFVGGFRGEEARWLEDIALYAGLRISSCVNMGDVEGSIAGGFIGHMWNAAANGFCIGYPVAKIELSVNYGAVTGSSAAGGLIGRNYAGAASLIDNVSTGTVYAESSGSFGGIAGEYFTTAPRSNYPVITGNKFFGADEAFGNCHNTFGTFVEYERPIFYIEGDAKSGVREWITDARTDCTEITSGTIGTGFYVFSDSYSLDSITVNGEANLILSDGCGLTVVGSNKSPAIAVCHADTFCIYGQAQGTGTLTATATGSGAGIGTGESGGDSGYIYIFGGVVNATSKDGAGIGGGKNTDKYIDSGRNIYIAGGTVTAVSTDGAGIGGGKNGDAYDIYILDGTVTAKSKYGAGIGGGHRSNSYGGFCGEAFVYGGTVTAGSEKADAIGCGKNATGKRVNLLGGVINGSDYGDYYTKTYAAAEKVFPNNTAAKAEVPVRLAYAELSGALTKFGCSRVGHHASSEWSLVSLNSCDSDGTIEDRCLICGEVMETRTLAAHGHRFYKGTCEYCGADILTINSVGSAFGENPLMVWVICGVLTAGVAIAVIFGIKRKKKKITADTEEL